MSKNDIWKHIVDYYDFNLNNNYNIITSNQIKESKSTWNDSKSHISQYEPRLLCKQDTLESRPDYFKENGLYILSIKNGTYILITKNIYVELEIYNGPPQKLYKRHNNLLLDLGNGESNIIENLHYNGILENIFDEKIICGPVLSGRRSCGKFTTFLDNIQLNIDGTQIEIDACYETENNIYIIELKNKKCNNFNIRQLYYPYRYLYDNDNIKNYKNIIALFIYKENRYINIYKYIWNDPTKMMDINCIGYYKYIY